MQNYENNTCSDELSASNRLLASWADAHAEYLLAHNINHDEGRKASCNAPKLL